MSEGDNENSSVNWPQEGDRVFTTSGDQLHDSWVVGPVKNKDNKSNCNTDLRIHGMIDGYKLGADLMVKRGLEDSFYGDRLLYPIIFCYRHCIELWLKYIIDEYGKDIEITYNMNHGLCDLWKKFKKILDEYKIVDSSADAAVANIIQEFSREDEGASSYRYPTNKKKSHFILYGEYVDLENMMKVMNKVNCYFVGCSDVLDEYYNSQ